MVSSTDLLGSHRWNQPGWGLLSFEINVLNDWLLKVSMSNIKYHIDNIVTCGYFRVGLQDVSRSDNLSTLSTKSCLEKITVERWRLTSNLFFDSFKFPWPISLCQWYLCGMLLLIAKCLGGEHCATLYMCSILWSRFIDFITTNICPLFLSYLKCISCKKENSII